MKAGDVKCPTCGAGFRDVAPDLDLMRASLIIGAPQVSETYGRCKGGHGLSVRLNGDEMTVLATSITPVWASVPR